MTIVGRAHAGGPVDDLRLTSGTWATRPGQIVLEEVNGTAGRRRPDHVRGVARPSDADRRRTGRVGRQTARTGGCHPAQLAALTPPGTVPTSQMLYRFARAGTDAQVECRASADRRRGAHRDR